MKNTKMFFMMIALMILLPTIVLGADPVHFVVQYTGTGNNSSILVPGFTIGGQLAANGDEVGLYTPSGLLAGAGVYEGANMVITANGDDDQTTTLTEGFKSGERYKFKLWRKSSGLQYDSVTVTYESGSLDTYSANGFVIITAMVSVGEGAGSVNNPPVLGFTDTTITGQVGTALSYTVRATDANNDTLSFSFSGTPPAGVTTTTAGLISGTPTASGSFTLQVIASDGKGGLDTGTVRLTISTVTPPPPTNRPPVLAFSDTTVTGQIGTALSYTVRATDADNDTVSFTFTGTPPSGVTTNATTGIISGTPTASGSFSLQVIANDGKGGLDTGTVRLTISAAAGPHFVVQYTGTGNNSSILVPGFTIGGQPAANGDEVGLYTPSGLLAGAAVYEGSNMVITANGDDDQTTTLTEGFKSGERYKFKLWRKSSGLQYDSVTVTYESGSLDTYSANGFVIITAMASVGGGTGPVNNIPVLSFTDTTISGQVGTALSYTVRATDADNDQITYSFTGTPPAGVTTTTAGLVSGTPTASGSFTLQVIANDGKGGLDTGTVRLSISAAPPPVNRPPVLAFTDTTVTGQVSAALSYTVRATDADDDAVSFSFTGVLPAGISTNTTTGMISGTPTASGSYTLQVIASDSKGGLDTATVRLTISVAAGAHYVVQYTGTGSTSSIMVVSFTIGGQVPANGDEIGIFTPSGLLAGAGIYDGGPLAITANGDNDQTTSVIEGFVSNEKYKFKVWRRSTGIEYDSVTVTYESGSLDTYSANAMVIISSLSAVIGLNRSPVLGFTDTTIMGQVGAALSYQIQATDADNDQISFSITGTPPPGVTIVSSGLISGTPTASGSFTIQVIASDGKGGLDTGIVRLAISPITPPINRSPVLAFSDTTITGLIGTAVSFTVGATDADNDQITYSFTGTPPAGVTTTTAGLISGTPTASGSFTLQVIASDGKSGGLDTGIVRLSISEGNRPPVLSFVDTTVIGYINVAFSFAVRSTDADNDQITYSFTGTPPAGITTTTAGLISGTPTASGSFTLQVIASDGKGGLDTGTVRLSIGVNRPPVIPFIDTTFAILQGSPISLQVGATDADGDPITYSFVGLQGGNVVGIPDGITTTAAGLVSGTVNRVAIYTLQVTASDGKGGSAYATITISGINRTIVIPVENRHFKSKYENTGNSNTVIVNNLTIGDKTWVIGDEIGVFTPGANGFCAGTGKYNGSPLILTVWGDNGTTAGIIEGFTEGQEYKFKIWDAHSVMEYDSTTATVQLGDLNYRSGKGPTSLSGILNRLVPPNVEVKKKISEDSTVTAAFSTGTKVQIQFTQNIKTDRTITMSSLGTQLDSTKIKPPTQQQIRQTKVVEYVNVTIDTVTSFVGTFRIQYDDALLRLKGINPLNLILGYFDVSQNRWVVVPTFVDTLNRSAIANVIHFSYWVLGDKTETAILPVELSSFAFDLKNDGSVLLQWITSSETNNLGFDVERSADQEKWERIGFIDGFGTTSEEHKYNFADKDMPTGTYYYRLAQKDFDGSISYSEIIKVTKAVPNEYTLSQNYPNPFNPVTTIIYQLPEATQVKLTIYNLLGQVVRVLVNDIKQAGSYTVQWDGRNSTGLQLPSGIYIYRIQAKNFTQSKKMMFIK